MARSAGLEAVMLSGGEEPGWGAVGGSDGSIYGGDGYSGRGGTYG